MQHFGALITRKPSSVIVEEGHDVSLVCQATGQPTPTVTWRKAFSHVPNKKTAISDGMLTITQDNKSRWWGLRMRGKESPWRGFRCRTSDCD
ncbi:hypothetical protein OS493_024639 [Desmophyllum pertusum]|uniref:Ig-like domain-containing protein n=1 Tax=Desmophyllum pertusum TaxID=174260 RepID=A0A9X0D290_9CNID|nr:hypothetical protein OS493_024639 [Desmophyllum pertusum]